MRTDKGEFRALRATSCLLEPEVDDKVMLVGELSLDGAIREVRGILPLAVTARDLGFEKLILPRPTKPKPQWWKKSAGCTWKALTRPCVTCREGLRLGRHYTIHGNGYVVSKTIKKISRTSKYENTSNGPWR